MGSLEIWLQCRLYIINVILNFHFKVPFFVYSSQLTNYARICLMKWFLLDVMQMLASEMQPHAHDKSKSLIVFISLDYLSSMQWDNVCIGISPTESSLY